MKKSHYNSVYNVKFHLVLVTKYRVDCLSPEILKALKDLIVDFCGKEDVKVLEFDSDSDHIHLLLDMHPNITPVKFVNSLKTVSSRIIRKDFGDYLATFHSEPTLWTRGYCLLSTGEHINSTIQNYIEQQKVAIIKSVR